MIAGQFGGQPDVTVVEADDTQALVDELLAEPFAPQQQLGAQTHDEHDDRVARVAHVLVVDVDRVVRVTGPGCARPGLELRPRLLRLDSPRASARRRCAPGWS